MEEQITLGENIVKGYTIPAGPVNIVLIVARYGVLGCGAIDISALERFGVAAARIAGKDGHPIRSTGDLLDGEVAGVNEGAYSRGVRTGMRAKDAALMLVR